MSKYTVKQMTDYLGLSTSGVHDWVDRYADLLSEAANDASGEQGRMFTEDDARLLWSVRVLRDENTPHEQIIEALRGGWRDHPPFLPGLHKGLGVPSNETGVLRQQIAQRDAMIQELSRQLDKQSKEIDRLQTEVTVLRGMLKDVLDRLEGKS